MPRVSIIIPTYNRSKYIIECLESVFSQSNKDYEIIVVDDGSTDQTEKVVELYRDRIIYIRKNNGGPASARNVGLKNALGEYVAFLDSDDKWLPQKLRIQVDYMDQHKDVGLVFANATIVYDNTQASERKKLVFSNPDPSFKKLFSGNFIPTLTVMARKQCFEDVGYFEEALSRGSDYEMWLRIAKKYKLGHISSILAEYRAHPENLTGLDFQKGYQCHIDVILSVLSKYPDVPDEYQIDMNQYYKNFFYRAGKTLYKKKQYGIGMEYLRRYMAYHPKAIKARLLYLMGMLHQWIFPLR